MKKLLCLALLLLLGATAAQAAETPWLDQTTGPFRVIATVAPTPLTTGPATMNIVLTDAASGAVRPVSAVRLITKSHEFGRDQTYVTVPDQAQTSYTSERLYFASSGTWDVTVQIFDGAQTYTTSATLEVGSSTSRILSAAKITVPVTLGALAVFAVGWKLWQRRLRQGRA